MKNSRLYSSIDFSRDQQLTFSSTRHTYNFATFILAFLIDIIDPVIIH